MRRLWLVRHGIAVDRDDPDCPSDRERPLTSEGERRVREAAAGMRVLAVAPEVIFTSPLVRARGTAEIVAGVLGVPKREIRETAALEPDCDPANALEEIAECGARRILAAGHAPHLDLFLAAAVGSSHTLSALGKCGAACLEFDRGWHEQATLIWLLRPGALREIGKGSAGTAR